MNKNLTYLMVCLGALLLFTMYNVWNTAEPPTPRQTVETVYEEDTNEPEMTGDEIMEFLDDNFDWQSPAERRCYKSCADQSFIGTN